MTELWVPHKRDTWPTRYGELKRSVVVKTYLGTWQDQEPVTHEEELKGGTTVKIVMVSRFGDVGITDELDKDFGYKARVGFDELENLRATPGE